MISNLSELIAPLSRAQFDALLAARVPALRPWRQTPAHAALMNMDMLAAAVDGRVFSDHNEFRVTRRAEKLPPMFYSTGGSVDWKKLSAAIDHGGSVVLYRADLYVPGLGALRDAIAAETGERVVIGCIVTNGTGGALSIHYDTEDIVVLQLEGSKRWMVWDTPVTAPVKQMPAPPAPEGPPAFDAVLEAGDVLIVPAGSWHRCENGPGRSLHLGIMLEPPTAWHALNKLVQELSADESFRAPLTRVGDEAAVEADLKARLKARIDALSLLEEARRRT
jgi:hypothetical protein